MTGPLVLVSTPPAAQPTGLDAAGANDKGSELAALRC